MLITALFTIAKTQKQHKDKHPLKKDWIKKMWHTHWTLLSHKKEWSNAICSNIDRPIDHHNKWSKLEKDKYVISLVKLNFKKGIISWKDGLSKGQK